MIRQSGLPAISPSDLNDWEDRPVTKTHCRKRDRRPFPLYPSNCQPRTAHFLELVFNRLIGKTGSSPFRPDDGWRNCVDPDLILPTDRRRPGTAIPPFAAVYASRPGNAINAATDILMIDPPPFAQSRGSHGGSLGTFRRDPA